MGAILQQQTQVRLGCWPNFTDEQVEAAVSVLRSGAVNYWTGNQGRLFEKEYAEYVGTRYAVAVTNGSVALELALRALGLGPGDEVITSCRTFIASASSAVLVGATPVFADVDRDSQNITADTIERKITPRTRAIIVVHLAGWPCEMDPICELARAKGLAVIEDCAQSHGARYRGRRVGSIGEINAFSFCQDKILTTAGEGGMVTTNDDRLWERAWAFKDHGSNYDAVFKRHHPPGFHWTRESFGTNGRMTEVQAAVGRVGLHNLDWWVARRRRNAREWMLGLKDLKAIRVTEPPQHVYHSYYKYYAFLIPSMLRTGWTRARILQELEDAGIPCGVGSCSEVYLERAFRALGPVPPALPVARELGETSLMFVVHPTLSHEDMDYMIGITRDIIKRATR